MLMKLNSPRNITGTTKKVSITSTHIYFMSSFSAWRVARISSWKGVKMIIGIKIYNLGKNDW